MNRASSLRRKTLITLNLGLILALLLSVLPVSQPAAYAAPAPAPAVNTADVSCYVAGVGSRVFLPLVRKAGGPAAAGAAGEAAVTLIPGAGPAPDSLAATERSLRYQVGKTYTYRYDLVVQSQSTSQDGDGSRASDGMVIAVLADADVAILSKDAANVFSGRLTLRNTTLCNADRTGRGTLIEDAELLRALREPLFFKQRSNGVITEVSFPAAAPAAAVNMQKGVLNSLQVTLNAAANQYTVQENGGQGAYQVTYTLAEGAGGLNIARSFNQDSFATLLFTGTDNQELLLQNTGTLFLDQAQGVLTSISVVEQIVSADQSQAPISTGGPLDGASATSGAKTRSSLKLSNVSNTPATAAAVPDATYATGGLGAVLMDDGPFRPGIDLETVNLAAEFAAFEAETDNPHRVQRISDLIDAADDATVVNLLQQRLQMSGGNESRAKAYIDILGVNSSPAAMALLLPAVQKAYGAAVQEHALIGLLAVRKVPLNIVAEVQRIANAPADPLRELGLLVLGGIVDKVDDPSGRIQSDIKSQLRVGLRGASTEASRILYLDAVGNAADRDALALIDPYLGNGVAFDLRQSALQALRKLPAADAEPRLLAVLNNASQDPMLREVAANVLRGRALTPAAAAALAAYDAEGTMAAMAAPNADLSFKKTWNKYLGGAKFGVDLPGSISATEKTSPVRSVSLLARQEVVAQAWAFRFNIALAELVSQRKGDKQEAKVTFSLLNNKIKKTFEQEVQCAWNKSANLYKATHTLLDFKTKIPVWGVITVDLGIRAIGNIALDYSYNLDVCNPLRPFVSGSITPAASATLEGYAALSVQVLRGGASVAGTLLNTSLPAKATAKRDDVFSLCLDITAKTKPLTVSVNVFAERRKLNGEWKRFYEATLFKYDTPQKDYPLLVTCFQ